MNHDPVYKRLRERSWRRPLNEDEQAELRAWLAAHPEVQAEWETEAELNGLLNQLPAAPVPSNFTARVLQAIARDASAMTVRSGFWWSWRAWLPRIAAAAAVIGLGLFGYHRYLVRERNRTIEIVAAVPEVNPEVLKDFETIRGLGSTPRPDEDLLAVMQ